MASNMIPPTASPGALIQTSPFLNIPQDILVIILKHLSYIDLIALSLTTKGLRYVSPPDTHESKPEKYCIRRIYRSLLPPRTNAGTCSYCSHPLCPPTCSPAIILDAETGIFYPSRLFPTEASAAPTSDFPETINCGAHFPETPPQEWDNTPTSTSPTYKTIWCDHHRCPPHLLSENFHKPNPSTGAYRLYHDYLSQPWTTVRTSLTKYHSYTQYGCPVSRHYGLQRTNPQPPTFHRHQITHFDILCIHCRNSIGYTAGRRPWEDRTCRCPHRWCRCGQPCIKVILVKAFDVSFANGRKRELYLGLAVEMDTKTINWTEYIKLARPEGLTAQLEIIYNEEEGFEDEGGGVYADCEVCGAARARDWEVDTGC
ncbi:hypothetical protein TWF481_007894 [Arthrobotrys musiformis]|uniref:F-box domain-containing protein n=1 Tax=Arthrobotrys musiformis TaxID=47236 RepID=A0AAV9W5N8_9PEZI